MSLTSEQQEIVNYLSKESASTETTLVDSVAGS